MKLQRVDLKKFSAIDCQFSISQDQTLLYIKIAGSYQEGSEGNCDGNYIFSQIVAYYFVYESICLVMDVSELQYTTGNTLLKSLDFFNEIGRDEDERNKPIVVVCSEVNENSITSLLHLKRAEKHYISMDLNEALKSASALVMQYLN